MTQKPSSNKERDASRVEPESGDAAIFNVFWESPVFELSGYAASARAALRGLEDQGVRVRLIPMNHDQGDGFES
jgi:hypothetical protein